MMRLLLVVGILIGLVGCKQGSQPCDWQEYDVLAKVTEINPKVVEGDTLYSVKLQFNGSSLKKEPQYLEQLQNLKIDKAFIARNKIRVGLRYKYSINEVVSGNCNSPIVSFHHQLN